MKTVGIICEYNPFHLGHARQYRLLREKAGEDCRIVCVMSGNYMQRGVPAMWDKFTRARAAAACGADLVLELPVTEVLQSAEGFARGGVRILSQLGCIDSLCFGAENADLDFIALAEQMDSPAALAALREGLNSGLSYAAARQRALQDTENVLSRPNNILAFEYCRAILQQGSNLHPLPIGRTGDYHAVDADPSAPSATAIRALYPDGNWKALLPSAAVPCFEHAPWYDMAFGQRAVLAVLRRLSNESWEQCAHGSEGLWSKAMKASRSSETLEEIIGKTKSRRYPRSRIQRLLLCAYLGISQGQLSSPPPYVRVLAASQEGCSILREAKKQGTMPIINAGEQPEDSVYFRLETRCSDLFTLFAAEDREMHCGLERSGRIFIQKSQN